MSILQAELIDMTKDLSEDTMKLLIGLVRQLVIPMDEKATKHEKTAAGRIGFMKEADIMEHGYDIDELNPVIAKMFGVEKA